VAPFLLAIPALAGGGGGSGPGPNGTNIAFDFNWSNGPRGDAASFLATVTATGATLENCRGGGVTDSTTACDFAFSYSIGGTPQTSVSPGTGYSTWAGSCVDGETPLTLFNCFNTNSFGQVFEARATGALSDFTMRMTCLNPLGATITGLVAQIYQINGDGESIGATPLAQIPVDLSSCPTATTWASHTFSAADFATIPLNFSGVTLTNGNFYGVYFGGTMVPGTPLAGSTSTAPAPPSLWLAFAGLGVAGLLLLWRRRPGSTWLPSANGTRDL
jgi:MYXO-CTERM domain-containing protein